MDFTSRLRKPAVISVLSQTSAVLRFFMSIDAWGLSPIFHYISSRKCKKVSLTIKVFVFIRTIRWMLEK